MDADLYLIRVQDIGEEYEYTFGSLQAAQKLFDDEMLPCSMWALDLTHGKSTLLAEKESAHAKRKPA